MIWESGFRNSVISTAAVPLDVVALNDIRFTVYVHVSYSHSHFTFRVWRCTFYVFLALRSIEVVLDRSSHGHTGIHRSRE